MSKKPKWRYTVADALTLLVGVPLLVASAAGYLGARSLGTSAGVAAFLSTALVGLVVAVCAVPTVVKRGNAPGWPEFKRVFGDSPFWWLGYRRGD